MKMENPLNNIERITLLMQDSSLIAVILGLIYYSTEVLFGASLGKMFLGIKIASTNRREATTSQLLSRFLLKHSNSILSVLGILLSIQFLQGFSSIILLILVIGFFFTLGAKRLALHDMITNTAVFYKENIKNY
ncbi:MAG: RDD family protein, partial [Candidatus Kapaibacterium sp.]